MLRQAVLVVASGLLLIGAALAVFMTVSRLQGYEVLAVQSNSMEPVFRRDDAVLTDTKHNDRLKPGQVASYRSLKNNQVIVSHRLLKLDTGSGTATTEGDALKGPDPTFPSYRLVGTVTAVLPHFGLLLRAFRQPVVLVIAVYLPALALIAGEARRLGAGFTMPAYRLLRSDRRERV